MQNPRDKVIITCAVTGNQTLPSMTPRNRLAPGEKVRSQSSRVGELLPKGECHAE